MVSKQDQLEHEQLLKLLWHSQEKLFKKDALLRIDPNTLDTLLPTLDDSKKRSSLRFTCIWVN